MTNKKEDRSISVSRNNSKLDAATTSLPDAWPLCDASERNEIEDIIYK